ncbi:GNAT family N-acetyltransferase [Streptomyces mobaraensis NBRC 13819 = DSM 40847]|uniref:GNAT family N-acetyltransferase n=1 Tax=Streptomyces mobaraensis TaxID=35621 RepID=A0A5N5WA04_STRMB|nr:GNAT family N-acetyltransferase [Streptomyces mobaraensis]KAB7845688.1 GNAT family N-acetyltransferase [Streptomyces mobaraensis]QTT78183.1 GNAT family N-acetyltransferase [Streptomyces mobaraensis NBRC 13819 = DSM 40847]
MQTTRAARPEDAAEIVRLRRRMFAAMDGHDSPGAWEAAAEGIVREQLSVPSPRMGAFVVDGAPAGESGAPHLAACAVGTVEQRLPAPGHPTGRFGFVFTVCTDDRYQGRGFGRATTEALLGWFAAQGVTRVDLHATPDAERLYRSLGFAEHSMALSLDVSRSPLPQSGR